MELLILSFSDLLNFIMVDVELLSVEGVLMELSFGLWSLLWVFKAHKGIDCLSILGEEFDVLDLSVFRE